MYLNLINDKETTPNKGGLFKHYSKTFIEKMGYFEKKIKLELKFNCTAT